MRYLDFIKGYVKIYVEGFYIERVINSCRKNNIELINLDRKTNTIITANVRVRAFGQFSKFVKNNKCKLKIIKKEGIPFVARKYRKRKVFLSALLILCLIILLLSRFVWNIEINSDGEINKD